MLHPLFRSTGVVDGFETIRNFESPRPLTKSAKSNIRDALKIAFSTCFKTASRGVLLTENLKGAGESESYNVCKLPRRNCFKSADRTCRIFSREHWIFACFLRVLKTAKSARFRSQKLPSFAERTLWGTPAVTGGRKISATVVVSNAPTMWQTLQTTCCH